MRCVAMNTWSARFLMTGRMCRRDGRDRGREYDRDRGRDRGRDGDRDRDCDRERGRRSERDEEAPIDPEKEAQLLAALEQDSSDEEVRICWFRLCTLVHPRVLRRLR